MEKKGFRWWLGVVADSIEVGLFVSGGFAAFVAVVYALAISPGGVPVLLTALVLAMTVMTVCCVATLAALAALVMRRE